MALDLICREFAFGSPEYRLALELRDAVLRRPLGLSLSGDCFKAEEQSLHLGCFLGHELAGTLVLKPVDGDTVKMRQVAVAPQFQRQGIGSRLVAFAEEVARREGRRRIIAHARDVVVPFYLKLGYAVEGAAFLEVSIPHRAIVKTLESAPATEPPS